MTTGAHVSETILRNQTTRRSPLVPSEKDNDFITPKNSIRPKTKQVSSRYLSPSHSPSTSNGVTTNIRRSNSPLVSRNSVTPVSKRSVSADRSRNRPVRPDLSLKPNNAVEVSAASKLLVTSTRSLSVSFQGESFSLPISKTKVTPQSPNNNNNNLLRKGGTPERKRTTTPLRGKVDGSLGDHVENAKPADQLRWPGRIRQANVTVLSKGLNLDCGVGVGVEKNRINCSGNVIRDLKLHQSMGSDSRRASIDGGGLNLDLCNSIEENPDGNSVKDMYSDTDSVSSGSTSGVQENGLSRPRIGSKGIIVSPKFWQETNSRLRRLQDSSSPLSSSPVSKLYTPQKHFSPRRFSSDNPSRTTGSSPGRIRPSSPSKFMTSPSPSRGMTSPRRNSVCGISSNFSETPSVLSFAVDVRRGKVGENRFFDAHMLRLLYNHQLQWRFVNARTEEMVLKQRHSVEENLWNSWITISDLRDSLTKKRHRLQLLRQKLKLASILKAQVNFLEDWAYFDKDHSVSLLGAIEALKASTLRLPVGEGATADLQSMKEAISSALDVMQAIGSSMNSLCLQVEQANLIMTELVKVSAKEIALLRICKDFLSVLSALKVKDCTLRTHMLQTSRVH
uniref:QWRF motif-containing protein 2-like n=1 Tax=Erigeron canadensis TaxID=72917 RepID=UPI001CB8C4CD|nr:QWRF motif-containing protein 2-like [Erigeron canadensis]